MSDYIDWADRPQVLLKVVQPGLIGLVDGSISTLAPLFASAYILGSHAALLVGLATATGAAISMGMSEALSDDGSLSGRGTSLTRGTITGGMTFIGGTFHTLPFLIPDVNQALVLAYLVVACELVTIAFIRKRFMAATLASSLVQVTFGGMLVVVVGYLFGHG